METIECIKTRRSVRKFSDRQIPKETIDSIISVAAYAPSWKNTRTSRWYVITNRALIDTMAEKAAFGFEHNSGIIRDCSCLIVQTAVKGMAGFEKDGSFTTDKKDGWEMYDGGIAAQTLCLAAHDKGVGSVIMGIIDDVKMAEILDVPENERVLAAIAMGFPAETPAAPKKFTSAEVTKYFE